VLFRSIRLQDRDHTTSLLVQACQEFGGHAFAIHDHSCDLGISHMLLIACQKCGDASDEMLVTAMGGHEEGMAVLIVQQQQCSAAQDHPQPPDQSAREEYITVHGFAMPIHITGQRVGLLSPLSFIGRMPELGSPTREGRGEAVGTTGGSHLRQKGFGVAVAIGAHPSGKQRQAIGSIAAQIPGAL